MPSRMSIEAARSLRLPKENNFDLLRFCFAVMVFFAHAYQLSRAPGLAWMSEMFSSSLAVQCFFVVSGFLIFMSYENSSGVGNYFEKRARRIYPAYFVVVVLCAVMGFWVSSLSFEEYFLSSDLYQYLFANLTFLNFLHPTLPGVFLGNPLAAVNGALWTLKIEVMFYLSVPFLVWCYKRMGLGLGLLLTFLASAAFNIWMEQLIAAHGGIYEELQRQLPGQLMYFVAGGALYYYFELFRQRAGWWLGLALVGLLAASYFQVPMLHAASLAVVVIYLALCVNFLGNFGKFGDFSYGIYILHFPILQLLIACELFVIPWKGFLIAVASTLALAYLLWHCVERPALRKSSHYIQASK